MMSISASAAPPALPGAEERSPRLASLRWIFAALAACLACAAGASEVPRAGSGYLTQGELYRYGGLVMLVNLLIFLGLGTPWVLHVM